MANHSTTYRHKLISDNKQKTNAKENTPKQQNKNNMDGKSIENNKIKAPNPGKIHRYFVIKMTRFNVEFVVMN